jgi:uncharacterized protein (TIGR02118 family)
MHKLLVLYPPPTDPAHFERYYRRVHLPLAEKLPGAIDLRFSLLIDAGGAPSPYFAVFEADFSDAAAMADAMASPAGQAVEADVPNYATGGAIVLNYPMDSLL